MYDSAPATRNQVVPVPDANLNFSQRPFLVYWEMTQACDLACKHCRASAMPQSHPLELTTEEGKRMLRQVKEFGNPLPHVVMTGGDAVKRPDLFELVQYGLDLGLPVSVAPAATPLLTFDVMDRFKAMGVQSISLSIDGSNPEKNDGFRGIPGTFDATIRSAAHARDIGLPVQVNTLVTASTIDDLPNTFALLSELEIMRWSLFLLISVGRGTDLQPITAAQSEKLFNWVYDRSREVKFGIKTTEAQHYRRIAYNRMRKDMTPEQIRRTNEGRGFGIRDGNGIMFISHIGGVYPSGFLPLEAGNIRTESPVEIYRNSELFTKLRDPEQYKGRCGICEFRDICGGSRARAFVATGDPLESDPLCLYQPAKHQAA